MKHLIVISVIALFSMSLHAQEETAANDSIETEVRDISGFDKVKASKGVNVTLVESDKESVEVRIKNGLLEDVITSVNDRELTVRMKTRMYKGMAVSVYVNYKKVDEITTASGASIDGNNTIYADNLFLSASSDSNISLEVDGNAIEAFVNAASIELSGTCQSQTISAHAGGKYNSSLLESKEAEIKASVGAKVLVNCSEKLIAKASAGAKVEYLGEPNDIETKGKVQAYEEE